MQSQTVENQAITTQVPATTSTSNEIVIVEGQLKKIIHQEGSGQCPKKGQQIYALYKGTLQNGQQFDSNDDRENPFNFTLGEGRVIKGWDQGFATMKIGQKATLVCSPDYAYGKRGSPPKIPPNSTLNFDVQLLDFKDKQKQKWELSQEQKIANATDFKNQGNDAFKKGAYKDAVKLYGQGLSSVQGQEGSQAQQIEKVLRLNLAQAAIKANDFASALINCTKVLSKDSTNIKALYRRGVAHLKTQQFQDAQADLQNLLIHDPNNAEAKTELQNIKIAQRNFREKEKKVFGNMFSKSGIYADEPKKQQAPKVEQTVPETQAKQE